MPLSLVIASTPGNASICNDSKQLKGRETAWAYKEEETGQAKVKETLGAAASFAPANPEQSGSIMVTLIRTVVEERRGRLRGKCKTPGEALADCIFMFVCMCEML